MADTGGSRFRSVLDGLAAVAMIIASVVLVWAVVFRDPQPQGRRQRLADTIPTAPVSLAGASLKGASTAKIAIIEYSDFQCPFCRIFATETHPELLKRYVDTGQVLLAFQHLPLESIHPQAIAAAVAANCAGEQNQFWGAHDQLFAEPTGLKTAESLDSVISGLPVDATRFANCRQNPIAQASVRKSAESARALGITGTPTFLFGTLLGNGTVKVTKRLSGAVRMDAVAPIVDELLKHAR